MVSFLIFALATVGLTNLVVESKIFSPLRKLMGNLLPEAVYEVFECHQCMGTWCGLVCGYLTWGCSWLLVLAACAGSFLASFAFLVMEVLETQAIFNFHVDEEDENK